MSSTTARKAGIADQRELERFAQHIAMRVAETDESILAKGIDDCGNCVPRHGGFRAGLLSRHIPVSAQQEERDDTQ